MVTYRFEFMTEGGDISYRIYRKCTGDNVADELVPLHRVNSNFQMEICEILCEKIGQCTYHPMVNLKKSFFNMNLKFSFSDVIQFDNTFSYFQSKKIHYKNVVTEPTNYAVL